MKNNFKSNQQDTTPGPGLSSLSGRVDEAIERFDAGWREGRRPRLEEELARFPEPEWPEVLRALLPVELYYRRKQHEGPEPTADEYQARFPGLDEPIYRSFGVAGTPSPAAPDAREPGQGPGATPSHAAHGSTPAGSPDPVGPPSAPGPRFRILRFHAEGGLGEVFVAKDEELDREVALKQIQGRYADHREIQERFLMEAKVTGRLEHPGIVPVYGLGHYADGRPYYAMKFIQGPSLKDAIVRFHGAGGPGRDRGERALEFRKLLGRFLDVCNAIAYAHSAGYLHRDLKPSNIMLGKYGETLVGDWGLAKRIDGPEARKDSAEPTPQAALASGGAETMSGLASGTPGYMSPEQAAGRFDLLGPASDIYSLGATLYHLLTGRAPFQDPREDSRTESGRGEGPKTESEQDLVLREFEEERRKIEGGDSPRPRAVNRAIAPALEAICLKAMAREPGDRYASPQALVDDIEHWLADEPVAAYREPWGQRLARWSRRHRSWVRAGAAALVVITLVSGAATFVVDRARRTKEEALAREQIALRKERQARQVVQVALQSKEEALAKEKQARVATLRTLLDSINETAESALARARLLRYVAGHPAPQRQALDLIGGAGRLWLRALDTLAELGAEAGAAAHDEPPRWERRVTELRSEASHWLGQLSLRRVREVPIPSGGEGLYSSWDAPLVAIHGNAQRIAVVTNARRPESLLVRVGEGNVLPALHRDVARLLVLDGEGNVLHRTSITTGQWPEANGLTPPDILRGVLTFPAPDRVELALSDTVFVWTLTDGRVERKPRLPQPPAPAVGLASFRGDWVPTGLGSSSLRPTAAQGEISNHAYVARSTGDSVTIWPEGSGAEPLLAWKATKRKGWQKGWDKFSAICKYIGYIDKSRALIIVTSGPGAIEGHRILLVDAKTGHRVEAELGDQFKSGRGGIHGVVDLSDGFATLESSGDSVPIGWSSGPERGESTYRPERGESTYRLVIWDTTLPVIRIGELAHARPVHDLAVSADGWAVTAGSDGVVRAWERERPAWSLGRSKASVYDLLDQDHSRPDWAARRIGRFGDSSRHGFGTRGLGDYSWLDFAAGGGRGFIVERTELTPDGANRRRTEIFDASDGRSLRAWSGTVDETGPILATSRDRRFAVIASEERDSEWTLDLWSLEQDRALGRLGRYPSGPEGRRVLPEFSPASCWLLMGVPKAEGGDVEIWRLPQVERIGTVSATALSDYAFDPEERHVLRVGDEVFDLEKASRKCRLELPILVENSVVRVDYKQFSRDFIVATWNPGGPDSGMHQFLIWDLATGKRTELGEAVWTDWPPGQSGAQLHPDRPLMLIYGMSSGGSGRLREGAYRVELWDVSRKALIKRIDRDSAGGNSWQICGDREMFYLPAPGPAGPEFDPSRMLLDFLPGLARRTGWLQSIGPPARVLADRLVSSLGLGPKEPKEAALPTCYSWSEQEAPREPPGSILSMRRSDFFSDPHNDPYYALGGSEPEDWILWRGDRGLLLQVGLDPARKLLAKTNDLGDGAVQVLENRLSPHRRVFVLRYGYFLPAKGNAPRRWVTHAGIWDVETGSRLAPLPAGQHFVTFDPTGKWLVTTDESGKTIWIYESASGRLAHRVTLPRPPDPSLGGSLRLHPQGTRLAFVSQGVLNLWDAQANLPVLVVDKPGHSTPVDCVAQHAGAGLVASGGAEGVILLWDRARGRFLRSLVGHSAGVVALAFHPDGTRLASTSADGSVILWEVDGKTLWTYPHRNKADAVVDCLTFDPSGSALLAGTSDGYLLRIDVQTGRLLARDLIQASGVAAIAISPSGKRVAIAGARGQVKVLDADTFQPRRDWSVDSAVSDLVFPGNDDSLVATGGQAVDFWDTETGRHLMTYDVPRGPVRALQADAKTGDLFVANQDGLVLVLNLGELNGRLGEMKLELPGLPGFPSSRP